MMSKKPLVYLACPYAHPSHLVRVDREHVATTMATILLLQGYPTFSPLTHGHRISYAVGDEESWPERRIPHEVWMELDLRILAVCDVGMFLKVPGWEKSQGIERELRFCVDAQKPKALLDPSVVFNPVSQLRLFSWLDSSTRPISLEV